MSKPKYLAFVSLSLLLLPLAPGVLVAEDTTSEEDCRSGCRVQAMSCLQGSRQSRRTCRNACREMRPGRERGACMRACARRPRTERQECRRVSFECRSSCGNATTCVSECGAIARECSSAARSVADLCRSSCRDAAEDERVVCGAATTTEECREEVGENLGACLTECSAARRAAVAACADGFGGCKSLCRPESPDDDEVVAE